MAIPRLGDLVSSSEIVVVRMVAHDNLTQCSSDEALLWWEQCSESEASATYVQNALDSAMEVLAPHVPANRPFIAEIQNSVDLLKQHLIC